MLNICDDVYIMICPNIEMVFLSGHRFCTTVVVIDVCYLKLGNVFVMDIDAVPNNLDFVLVFCWNQFSFRIRHTGIL